MAGFQQWHEFVTYDSKTTVLKSLNELALQYLCDCLCEIRSFHLTAFVTQGSTSGYPKMGQKMTRNVSPIIGRNGGTASQLIQSRPPRWLVLRELFTEEDYFLFIFFISCTSCKIFIILNRASYFALTWFTVLIIIIDFNWCFCRRVLCKPADVEEQPPLKEWNMKHEKSWNMT